MIITNNYNLPQPIYDAIVAGEYRPKGGDRFSTTDLVNPPLMRTLKVRHWDEIEQDASEFLWLLLGKVVHKILEGHGEANAFTEEKLVHKYGDYDIVGKSDNYKDEVVHDFKLTSVGAFYKEKPEWIAAQNIYAYLWKQHGFDTKALKIQAILRDWIKFRAFYQADYPDIAFQTVELPLWSIEETDKYIAGRLLDHTENPERECFPIEKWALIEVTEDDGTKNKVPEAYAVKKKGGKQAIRVYSNESVAEKWIYEHQVLPTATREVKGEIKPVLKKDVKEYEIEVRKGEPIRCLMYCSVGSVCPFHPDRKKVDNERSNT
jgi:hypothetical protein